MDLAPSDLKALRALVDQSVLAYDLFRPQPLRKFVQQRFHLPSLLPWFSPPFPGVHTMAIFTEIKTLLLRIRQPVSRAARGPDKRPLLTSVVPSLPSQDLPLDPGDAQIHCS